MINQHDQETDIGKCIQFINKIKEHRHSKIKTKHISKFEHLYFKRFGYHHNFTRNSQLFNNTDHFLSRQSNVPSNISTTSPRASNNLPVPATPMGSTPSCSMESAPTTAPRHPSSSSRHTCKTDDHIKKAGNQPFQNLPYYRTVIPPTERSKFCHNTQVPSHGSLYNSGGRGFLQTSIQWSWRTKIRCQSSTQTMTQPVQQPGQPQSNTMQGTHTTQTRHIQSGIYSWQGGWP